MSVSDKWELLRRMRGLIDGLFSEWARDAKEHIEKMEKNMLKDDIFGALLKEWDEKLLPQCPGEIWMGMRKGTINAPTASV
jgi:hypothetical protein